MAVLISQAAQWKHNIYITPVTMWGQCHPLPPARLHVAQPSSDMQPVFNDDVHCMILNTQSILREDILLLPQSLTNKHGLSI